MKCERKLQEKGESKSQLKGNKKLKWKWKVSRWSLGLDMVWKEVFLMKETVSRFRVDLENIIFESEDLTR